MNAFLRHGGLVAALALTVSTAACAGGAQSSAPANSQKTANVMVSTTPLGSVVKQITDCAGGTTTVLMPVGADPHDFAPSSKQVTEMVKADLFVANGLGLEGGLAKVMESAKADGAKVYEVANDVEPIPFGEAGHDHEGHDEDAKPSTSAAPGSSASPAASANAEAHDDHDGHDHATPGSSATPDAHDDHDGHDHATPGSSATPDAHDDHDHATPAASASASTSADPHAGHNHGSMDPHFWLAPQKMGVAAEKIGAKLGETTGNTKYAECGKTVQADMNKLDAEVKATLAVVPAEKRVLVTDHEAFGYFAQAYDFEQAGVVIPGGSTEAEPSSGEISKLVKTIKDEKVSAIFSNASVNPQLVEQIAKEAGTDVKVVPLYVGSVGEKGSGAETYPDMMRTNAKRIAENLAK